MHCLSRSSVGEMVKDQVYEDRFWSPRHSIVYDHKYRAHYGQNANTVVVHLRNCNTRFEPFGAGLNVAEIDALSSNQNLTVNDVRNAYFKKCPNQAWKKGEFVMSDLYKLTQSSVLTFALIVLSPVSIAQAVNVNPLAFDFNSSGKIDTTSEKEALINWINENSELSESTDLISAVDNSEADERTTYDTTFRLRRNFKEISLLESPDDFTKQLPQLGALFSHTSDLQNDRDIFSAQGAIYLPFLREPGQDLLNTVPTEQTNIKFKSGAILGLSFNYLDNGGAEPATDDLNFYAGYQEFRLGGILGDGLFRASAQYETDFDFDSSALRGDARWFPINPSLGINTRQNFGNGKFALQNSFSVDGTYKQVFDIGDRMQLASQDSYYGVSTPIGIDLFINDGELIDLDKGVSPLVHLYTRWTPTFGDLPTSDFEEFFEAGAEVFVGKGTNHTISFDYTNGTMPFNGTEVEQFTTGLTVKF